MKVTSILLISLTAFVFSNCNETQQKITDTKEAVAAQGDVTFAKSTFEALAKGDSAVIEKIDWPVFTSLGDNIGASYGALASGVEKQQLASNFITQFATSFRESGGSVEAYKNWRVTLHDSQKTEVAADTSNGVLTIIVSERDGVERVSSINLVK